MKTSLIRLSVAAGLSLIAGCVPLEPPPPLTTTVSYSLPVITPVEPDKQTQESDGVRVTAAPVAYAVQQVVHQEIHPVPTLLVVNNEYPGELVEIPRLVVSPKKLRFKVTINNQLERVVRMAGTAVAFQVAGKTVAADKAGYEDFLNGIILPRQEGDYEITGPDVSALPNHATIGLFLYDMVTATDPAGNPTKRSNFEFYYTLTREAKTQEVSVTKKRVMLDQQGHVIGRP